MVPVTQWLVRVANMYPEGAIPFYDKLGDENPWKKNTDFFERATREFWETNDDDKYIQDLNIWEETCRRLIDGFKRMAPSQKFGPEEAGFWQGLRS